MTSDNRPDYSALSARERLMLLAQQFSESDTAKAGFRPGCGETPSVHLTIADGARTESETATARCACTDHDAAAASVGDAVALAGVMHEQDAFIDARGLVAGRDAVMSDELQPLQAQLTEAEAEAFARVRAEAQPVRRIAPLRPAPELRAGMLTSVVRIGGITAYPPPLFDPPATAAPVSVPKRTGGRLHGVSGAERDAARFGGSVGVVAYGLRDVVPVSLVAGSAGASDAERAAAAGRAQGSPLGAAGRPGAGYAAASAAEAAAPDGLALRVQGEIRALAAGLIEVMSGRRSADQVAAYLHPGVRVALGEWLRAPARSRYSGAAVLRRVRLSGSANAVEAMALVQDGSRMRAVAFRFDAVVVPAAGASGSGRRPRGEVVRAEAPRWLCTALQAA